MSGLSESFSGYAEHGETFEDLAMLHVEVRRNKLLGLWAAELKGLEPTEAEDFALGFVADRPACKTEMMAGIERTLKALGVTGDEIASKIKDLEFQALMDVYAIR